MKIGTPVFLIRRFPAGTGYFAWLILPVPVYVYFLLRVPGTQSLLLSGTASGFFILCEDGNTGNDRKRHVIFLTMVQVVIAPAGAGWSGTVLLTPLPYRLHSADDFYAG